jgi:hypothetical protein
LRTVWAKKPALDSIVCNQQEGTDLATALEQLDLVEALRRRIDVIKSQIGSAKEHLGDLEEQHQRFEQALEVLSDGSHSTRDGGKRQTTGEKAVASVRKASKRRGRRSRNPGSDALIAFVNSQGNARVTDVARKFGVTALTARTWLNALVDQGKLTRAAQGRTAVFQAIANDAEEPSHKEPSTRERGKTANRRQSSRRTRQRVAT